MGNVTVSDSVITEIAFRSICSVYGVEPENKDVKKFRKNIAVERTPEDNVIINVKLEVPYGENILEFSRNIMKSIADNISQMTEKVVEAVNITVVGVSDKEFSKTN